MLAGNAVSTAWPLLDPHDIKGTQGKLAVAVRSVTTRLGSASAAGALQAYRIERAQVGVKGVPPRVPMPPPVTAGAVTDAVVRGLAPLYGPVDAGAVSAAQTTVRGYIEQIVLDQGRAATIAAADADPEADKWARIPSPGACAFCIMLASRLGAYRTQETASFTAHPSCHCVAQVQFAGVAYATMPEVAKAQEVWKQLPSGLTGADQRLAFRQAWEGRGITAKAGDALPGTRGGAKGTGAEDARPVIREEAARIAKETDVAALRSGLVKARADLTELRGKKGRNRFGPRRAAAILSARIDAITVRLNELDPLARTRPRDHSATKEMQ